MAYHNFQYDLRSAKDGRDLGSFIKSTSQRGPFKEGEMLPLRIGILEQNNNRNVCDCTIVRMSRYAHEPNKYVAYIKKLECWDPRPTEAVDWDGLDGWLELA